MAYFKIGGTDYSDYVNSLKISTKTNYNSQTNAAGNTVVDYINSKRTITVGIIPLNDAVMNTLTTALNAFNVAISFRNPNTALLETNVDCIIPQTDVEYYTIWIDGAKYKAMSLTFTEL